MKAVLLTYLILKINALIDSEKYQDISIEEIHIAIENEKLLRFIKERCGQDIDFSVLFHETMSFEKTYEERMNRIFNGYAGEERRKWGVNNSGLCLVLAWTNELLQAHFASPNSPEWKLEY